MKTTLQIIALTAALTVASAAAAYAADSDTPIWKSNGHDPYAIPGTDSYENDEINPGVLQAPPEFEERTPAKAYQIEGSDRYAWPMNPGVLIESRDERAERTQSRDAREREYRIPGSDSYEDDAIYDGHASGSAATATAPGAPSSAGAAPADRGNSARR